MSLISDLTAKLSFSKKDEAPQYYFALNIGMEKISAAVWSVEGNRFNILNSADAAYSSEDELLNTVDKVLDAALGDFVAEPDKILFGVPDSWLTEDNLKEQYLSILRKIVKELDLKPMAYVSTSQALSHLLESLEGAPTTAILVGFEKAHLAVSVVRAGKLDGTKILSRGDNPGQDVEKALLSFSEIEVLPSKILVYGDSGQGDNFEKIKSELLSFPWMQKLSFLHFPKISVLEEDIACKAVSFAGATEQNPNVKYQPQIAKRGSLNSKAAQLMEDETAIAGSRRQKAAEKTVEPSDEVEAAEKGELGFVAGDVTAKALPEQEAQDQAEESFNSDNLEEGTAEPNLTYEQEESIEKKNPVEAVEGSVGSFLSKAGSPFKTMPNFGKNFKFRGLLIPVAVLVVLLAGYLFFYKANVKVYVEPKILEKDTTVTADPSVQSVDEANNKIPGQIVETTVSGSGKGSATGQKQVGDPAKGTIKVINNSADSQTLQQGSTISVNGIKFTLDSTINVASTSATADSKSTADGPATASVIGADGNVPSGTQFSSGNSQVAILAEGNFSGGTSKQVTVVSDDDQKKLLAQVSSDLRNQAQQQLQGQLNGKKILAEALAEDITKKSYNKNVGDQAGDFSLNLTAHYKGTAYSDADLRTIVAKLVETNVPSDFQLNLSETETQADVSNVNKDGSLVFLAKFKAKLVPKLDEGRIKQQIRGQSLAQAAAIIKGFDNVLDSDITTSLPFLPMILQRIPIFSQNINIQTGLK